MKLIDNAKDWWRMLSIQVAGVWAALIAAWPMLTEAQRNDLLSFMGIPPEWLGGVTALVMFATLVAARVKKQPVLHGDAQ